MILDLIVYAANQRISNRKDENVSNPNEISKNVSKSESIHFMLSMGFFLFFEHLK